MMFTLRQLIASCLTLAASAVGHAATPAGLFVNGGELYFLRTESEFALHYSYLKHRIVFDINWPDGGYETSRVPAYVPNALRYAWPERVSQGFGIIDTNFVEGEGTKSLANTVTAAMSRADDYVWFFPEKHNYLKGAPDEWVNAIAEGVAAAKGNAKLILFGCFSKDGKPANTPKFIANNIRSIERLPFDGLSVYLREDSQTYDQGVTRKLLTDQRIRRNELQGALAPLAKTRTTLDLFLEAQLFMAPDVFDDAGWRIVIGNVQRMANVLPATGFKGVLLDTENYIGDKCWLAYSKPDLQAAQQKAFERGKQFRQALGDLTVINTIAPIYAMTAGNRWGQNYELLGPFTAGMVEAAPKR